MMGYAPNIRQRKQDRHIQAAETSTASTEGKGATSSAPHPGDSDEPGRSYGGRNIQPPEGASQHSSAVDRSLESAWPERLMGGTSEWAAPRFGPGRAREAVRYS